MPAVVKPDPSDSVISLPLPFTGQLSPGNAEGDVKNAQFAAEVVRSVGKEKLSLETGGLAAKEE